MPGCDCAAHLGGGGLSSQRTLSSQPFRMNNPLPGAALPRATVKPCFAMCGVLVRKERWSLTWKAWIVVLLLAFGIGLYVQRNVYTFLAVTERLDADTMVVEGWMDQTDLVQAVDEFKRGHYRRVITTGGPVHGVRAYVNDYSTSAHIAAQQLIALGVPADVVQSVPSHVRDRNRTYGSAVALRDWLREHRQTVSSFVVVTESVHARRSRLLFEKAFDGEAKVGIVALKNVDYDADHWWRYSEGVKDVLCEVAGYLYVRLFFHPPNHS